MANKFPGLKFLPMKGAGLLHGLVTWCKICYAGKQKNAQTPKQGTLNSQGHSFAHEYNCCKRPLEELIVNCFSFLKEAGLTS